MATGPDGLVGRVVGRIRGGPLPGEVRVVHGGLPHDYIAYSEEPLPLGAEVLVISTRGARQIDVEPWDIPGLGAPGAAGEPERL